MGRKTDLTLRLFVHHGGNQNCFVQQIKFDCNLSMVSAIRAQLPIPWQYNLKHCKSQDILDRKNENYPEFIRKIRNRSARSGRNLEAWSGGHCFPAIYGLDGHYGPDGRLRGNRTYDARGQEYLFTGISRHALSAAVSGPSGKSPRKPRHYAPCRCFPALPPT